MPSPSSPCCHRDFPSRSHPTLQPGGAARERVLAPIALPDLFAHDHRDVPTARWRRLGRGSCAGTVSPLLDAGEGCSQARVQHLLQIATGQLMRQRLADRLQIGHEGGTHRHPQVCDWQRWRGGGGAAVSFGPEPLESFRGIGSFRSRSAGAGCGRRAATRASNLVFGSPRSAIQDSRIRPVSASSESTRRLPHLRTRIRLRLRPRIERGSCTPGAGALVGMCRDSKCDASSDPIGVPRATDVGHEARFCYGNSQRVPKPSQDGTRRA